MGAPALPGRVVVARNADGTLQASAGELTMTVGRVAADGFDSVSLLMAALGSCTLGTMLSFAENAHLSVDGVQVVLEPHVESNPARVSEVEMTMRIEGDIDERRLASLRRVAERCKVHTTLAQGVRMSLTLEHGAV